MENDYGWIVWLMFAILIFVAIFALTLVFNSMKQDREAMKLSEQPTFIAYSYTSDKDVLSVLEHFNVVYGYLDEHPGIKYKERLMLRTHMDFIYDYIDIIEESDDEKFDKNEEM